MAQDESAWSDVQCNMSEQVCALKEDGCLNADTDLKQIVYHPTLNVILICATSGIVRVLDVNSGQVLQTTSLTDNPSANIFCRYIPGQDRVVFCDGKSMGVRSDYNGVLLLDTILQKAATNMQDDARLELLLSEAIIFRQCLIDTTYKSSAIDLVINELTSKILLAQTQSKKGIKAQKWNTVCLELPLEFLAMATSSMLSDLTVKNQHTPEISVISTMDERVSELLGQNTLATNRRAMSSEAKRRETFSQWPHMDYLWALPDQMAQAGFYHQPNATGDDRAMCFTCTVCLVSWEKTDEPWNEHERHSPTCPFVMGEYTQNVPLSVTFATSPAVDCTYRGTEVKIIGTSSVPHLLPSTNPDGLIAVHDVSGKPKRTHIFFVKTYDSHLLEKVTKDFGFPGKVGFNGNNVQKKVTALTLVGSKQMKPNEFRTKPVQGLIRPAIICGLSLKCSQPIGANAEQLMDVDESQDASKPAENTSCLYLVVYDFQYTKDVDLQSPKEAKVAITTSFPPVVIPDESLNEKSKQLILPTFPSDLFHNDNEFDKFLIKKELSQIYHSIIPGDSNDIFIPTKAPTPACVPNAMGKTYSGPRAIIVDCTGAQPMEADAGQAGCTIIAPDLSYHLSNGPLAITEPPPPEKSISDHIVELQTSKKERKLNYSRPVQCISIPSEFKHRSDLYVSDLIPTQDARSVLVVLKSNCELNASALLLFALDFSGKMVKLAEQPKLVCELTPAEAPVEIRLINFLDKNCEHSDATSTDGIALMVCQDGIVRVLDVATLTVVSIAQLVGQKFVSAVYCNSLERLCASTATGELHFFALNDNGADSTEEQDDDEFFPTATDLPGASVTNSDAPTARCFQEPPECIPLSELQRLRKLCDFEIFKGGYNPVVPPCWSGMHQGQQQRRHPQHRQKDKEQITRSFRLQTDTTTWDEHVFELTLPTPINIGHVDVSFTLHSSVPSVELTLLRQKSTSIGLRGEMTFAVDDKIQFDQLQSGQNPIVSPEYLRAHNAEVLAGPIGINSCIDLSVLSGCVTLSSPKLFKMRNRNLLLHMKAVGGKESPKEQLRNNYIGCDALHEITITIYGCVHTDVPHERAQRCAMLESNEFVESLLMTITETTCKEEQSLTLDILSWVASIRMARNRTSLGEAPMQQDDFLHTLFGYLESLLRKCVIGSSRSVAHKCVKLIITSIEGASLMADNGGAPPNGAEPFEDSVLKAIIDVMDEIGNVQSPGALHWFMTLVSRVTRNMSLVVSMSHKLIDLLTSIADQLSKRDNPYHLILRSRFGLYETPLEPEIFDVDLPIPPKGSSSTLSYASVVAGEQNPANVGVDFHANFAFSKDHLDPKDVLLNLGETKSKLRSIVPGMMMRGLLETEALHFTCASASDGTRVERADTVMPAFLPLSVTHPGHSGPKKVGTEHLYNGLAYSEKVVDKGAANDAFLALNDNLQILMTDSLKNDEIVKLCKSMCPSINMIDLPFEDIVTDTGASMDAPHTSTNKHQQLAILKHPIEDTLAPSKSLLWQQLLITPPQQVIIVERMHSGARRFVILDFGQPIVLTDVFLPSSSDLLSVSIDIALKDDESDMERLVLATDFGSNNLVLTDLQPPPLCRYLKITVVGKYGMSPTRCRIPIGAFYGHLIVLPDEVPLAHSQLKSIDLEKQLSVLSMLLEDVSCRYSLACFKLKNLLDPFLAADTSNAAHLNAYMEIMRDKNTGTTRENVKIFNAYREAVTYQRQLNTVKNVMMRVELALKKRPAYKPNEQLAEIPVDKLRALAEVLFEILLILDAIPEIPFETCEKLFKGFCITQRSHLQFLCATVLDHSCRRKSFWGIFLASTLTDMFSCNYIETFPQDRVFILLAYLVKRCTARSVALDATLLVIAHALEPLATTTTNGADLVGVKLDLPLLNWLLMFLSLQLDMFKSSMRNATRWDWVSGELTGKSSESAQSSYKRKFHSKFLMYKQQLDNLDNKQIAKHIVTQNINDKLDAACKSGIFDKLKEMKKTIAFALQPMVEGPSYPIAPGLNSGYILNKPTSTSTSGGKASGKENKRRENAAEQKPKMVPISEPQYIDGWHTLAVVRGLLRLLLAIDHSCAADLFVLSCKVISRLIKISNLTMDQYLNDERLLKLINLCIDSDLPFVTHALACLLQDSFDIGKTPIVRDTDALMPSTSLNSDFFCDVETLCDFEIEDAFLSEPAVKQGKSTTNTNQLPSVFESDDSDIGDILDEVIERGRSLLKKKSLATSYGSSCAMDQRLDVGVEAQAEVTLRRLSNFNATALIRNLNTPVESAEGECNIPKWPSRLLAQLVDAPQEAGGGSNSNMLVCCFDQLFLDLDVQSASKIEQILQLWLTLNCQSDEKFNHTLNPYIPLNNEAVCTLIKTIAWCPDLTLRTWCGALQILTLMCNVPQSNNAYDANETDICRTFGKTSIIINHPDFVKMFLRLLSGSGVQFCDKGLAGPGLCKAMNDFLMRLQIRCDVNNPASASGNKFKSHMLKVVYYMVQPTGPLASKLGPLDAQCKLLHTLACLDYNNADMNIAMSIMESTGTLVLSHVTNVERIKCVNIGERLNTTTSSFSFIFASVLGAEGNKQDKPVSWDILLIYLLKLLSSLFKTPLEDANKFLFAFMDTDAQPSAAAQTDEHKAEQILNYRESSMSAPPHATSAPTVGVPCLADTVLQHHPTIIRFCKALATCKSTTLSMITQTQSGLHSLAAFTASFKDSATVADAIFDVLTSLVQKATQKQLIMPPLLLFLSQTPQLSEPLIWFIINVLDSSECVKTFFQSGAIDIICKSLIASSKAPNTVSLVGGIASVMQHFVGQTSRVDASAIGVASSTKKQQQASLENNLNLVNYAPQGSIKCSTSTTAHSPEILILGQGVHRRARTPQWSYHFYPEEAHADLTITLPSAILLREVHILPHQGSLATCPSAVSLEVSANGPSRLVPACAPIATSGMSFIRLHLPAPEVVNCVQIRLYKPRDASNIGLSQIRLLGTSAFGGSSKQQMLDLAEDDSHCKFSLGWLRLLYHCCTIVENTAIEREIIERAASIPQLLSTCCGLLLVPSHIPSLYVGYLGKVICELSLFSREHAAQTIITLLESRTNAVDASLYHGSSMGRAANSPGAQSACEVLFKLCTHQDADTAYRLALVLTWLRQTATDAIRIRECHMCSPAYVYNIATIIWDAKSSQVEYELDAMISMELFQAIYDFNTHTKSRVPALKSAIDSLLCSICYVRSEFFPLLLEKLGVLIPNQSTDPHAPISDDRKDSESMTDDSKHNFDYYYEWYERLTINDMSDLLLSTDVLETIALVARSPIVIQQLLDSRLPHMLNAIIYDYCNETSKHNAPMCTLENVTSILKFFSDLCDEKIMRDWLGSTEGSQFWTPLLQYLCKGFNGDKASHRSMEYNQLDEECVRFLSKCCLCHAENQKFLAITLCEVIAQQTSGISGFLRRLILQLVLESEKVLVSIKSDETMYLNSSLLQPYMPVHPAYKQAHGKAILYLGTNTPIAEILEQYIAFSTSVKSDQSTQKSDSNCEVHKNALKSLLACDSDLSVAAGVTAKDKRVKDAKNYFRATPLKKMRFVLDDTRANDVVDARVLKCLEFADMKLPLDMTIAQLLRTLHDKGVHGDITALQLTIAQNKGETVDEAMRHKLLNQPPLNSILQVFSSMGGLALLAQHLPTVYPETVHPPPTEKMNCELTDSDWVKVDGSDDLYEDIDEGLISNTPTKSTNPTQNVPHHSLTAFGLFLRLPGYAEVLLKDLKKAHCLLRLVLGVTDDGEGGDIFQNPIADSLPTLPFETLKLLYEASPLSTDDGTVLRRLSISTGVMHLILVCLGIFTHQTQGQAGQKDAKGAKDEKSNLYWAKGTGFGTGSTQQSWNVEQALLKQRSEEEHVTALMQVLSSYINPKGKNNAELANSVLPVQFVELLSDSPLLPALCSYLCNDSVLDMARHIPLYRAALELLRAMAVSCQLVKLLVPAAGSSETSISTLLKNMKICVDIYASKLRSAQSHKSTKANNNKSSGMKIKYKNSGEHFEEVERDEGLALLMPDIQLTATMVCKATDKLIEEDENFIQDSSMERPLSITPEEQYLKFMKKMQFDTFEMLQELPEGGYKFVISHHYESNVRAAGDSSHPTRVKRLAQEAVTLASSLPLSYSSSVFVRCDTDRLDIMKVLITGPADTPYANGCYEFDVYFPPDYPLSPMMINLETTGHHSIRFNPNLYNDGKVCLSVLNTWHGRPEEKWNSQTSSFLQVLVSIQSLILVSEPYFNEPGYERSRGTPAGSESSLEYNANICQATVRWAMLEQLTNPCSCFKDIIFTHFYMKRFEVIEQCEKWIRNLERASEMKSNRNSGKRNVYMTVETFKKIFDSLQVVLLKLTPPAGVKENESAIVSMEVDESPTVTVDIQQKPQQTNGMSTNLDEDDESEMELTSLSDPN